MNLSKQKKLIFINRYFYPDQSATSQLLTDLAFDLAQDQNVHIITSQQRYNDPSIKLLPFEIVNQVQIHRVWTSRFGRQRLLGRALDYLFFYFTATWKLWKLIATEDIVIVKTDPPLMSVIVCPIVKWCDAKLINWLQDIFPEIAIELKVPGMQWRIIKLLQWFRNKSLFCATHNVVLGESMVNYLSRIGILKEKITVIHNWADGENIQPVLTNSNPLRTEWLLQDKFVVGYSGNMGRAHEFATILDAAQKLIQEKRIIFLFIGNGPQKVWLEQEVIKRQLNNVIFKPYQPREYLKNSLTVPDVHLVSLRPILEGLIVPSKFYGIVAAGRPVLYIGDRAGEIPKILNTYQCGFTVDEQDSEVLVTHIKQFAENPEFCQTMGDHARQVFEKLFDKPLALTLWRQVIEKV
jgi:glycosyltransferase involved in cell wall biosynthesis